MAELFLVSIVDGITKKIGSAALQQIGLAWGVDKELVHLQATLNYIKAVLLDAELQRSRSHELILWMDLLKDVCYSINDVTEEFELHGLQRQAMRMRPSFTKKVSHFCLFSRNPLVFRYRMGRRIMGINKKLDKIAADRDRFHLREAEECRQIVAREDGSLSYSCLGRSRTFGRELDKENIVALLQSDKYENEALNVIPIVGIGGMGKTTLAKMVYNDERLSDHFQLKAWVCVSEDFHVSRLVMKIVTALTGVSCDNLHVGQVVARLQQELEGRRFLLVLDDIWNEDRAIWAELSNLLVGATGSMVIVTTRNHSVASVVGTIPCLNLEGIAYHDSMSLFISWAFKEGEEMLYPNLIRIGEEIVRKCNGVPLAVRTLGCLLYMKRDEREWVSVKDNEIWRINQKEGDILPVLRLSYDQLPSHLKRCFAHLSTYPKDSFIGNHELVARWIALGFIVSTDQTEELEIIGNRYIHELYSRSFFEEVTDFGYILVMSMHNLMHDLAVLVAQNEYRFVDFHGQHVHKDTRHLVFSDNESFLEEPSSCLLGAKNVRSVTKVNMPKTNKSFADFCISKFKYLQVLDLSYSGCVALSSSVGGLKHLRYLDLRCSENITLLPDSTCKLLCLQYLNLSGCLQLKKLPREFGNLVSLRVLLVSTKHTRFPVEVFKGLVSLRYLLISQCHNLENLFDDDSEIWIKKSLLNLRTLHIKLCKNLVSLPRGLRHLTLLENLLIDSCEKLDLASDVEGIRQHADGGLVSLRYFVVRSLPKLIALPQWLLQGAANTLNHLVVAKCCNLTTLTEGLTSLQKVWIVGCPRLISLPDTVGTLKELFIKDCPKLIGRCRMNIGEDWEKISSVPEIYLDSPFNIQESGSNRPSGEKKWFESRAYLKLNYQVESLAHNAPAEN